VFTHLPAECDRQDRAWRLAWARCLDDVAGDLEAGRAPLPRCTGERWALQRQNVLRLHHNGSPECQLNQANASPNTRVSATSRL